MGSPKAVPDPVDRAFHCQVSHNWKALVKLVFFLFGPETFLKSMRSPNMDELGPFPICAMPLDPISPMPVPWHSARLISRALFPACKRSKSQFSNGCSGISVYLSPSASLPSDLVICDVIQSNPSTLW